MQLPSPYDACICTSDATPNRAVTLQIESKEEFATHVPGHGQPNDLVALLLPRKFIIEECFFKGVQQEHHGGVSHGSHVTGIKKD